MFKIGDWTRGTFPCEIIADIPGGSRAELFLARLQNTEHLFAIKAVDATAPEMQKAELYREAMILKQLCHPNLPEIFEYSEEQDKHYFIMSYHGEKNLQQYVKEQKVISEGMVQKLILNCCEVLAYLHQKNIVYGDLKPSNLLYKQDGSIILLDFGTAEYVHEKRNGLFFHGSMGYAAPECWHRETVIPGPQTDIFALGALMYFLLEGKEPKTCYGRFAISDRQKKNRWQPVLDKCCALHMHNRYQSVAQVFDLVKRIKL